MQIRLKNLTRRAGATVEHSILWDKTKNIGVARKSPERGGRGRKADCISERMFTKPDMPCSKLQVQKKWGCCKTLNK